MLFKKNPEDWFLTRIRKWWRPLACVAIAMTMFVHGILVPVFLLFYKNQYFSDLTGLAALITAITAAFAVREWGKAKGVKD